MRYDRINVGDSKTGCHRRPSFGLAESDTTQGFVKYSRNYTWVYLELIVQGASAENNKYKEILRLLVPEYSLCGHSSAALKRSGGQALLETLLVRRQCLVGYPFLPTGNLFLVNDMISVS